IRTHGGLSPSLVFKTSAFDHSATPPANVVELHYFAFCDSKSLCSQKNFAQFILKASIKNNLRVLSA
ncbi:MAG: hypothetical protein AAFQ28_03435, partial [Pseudomonadota bacterium]